MINPQTKPPRTKPPGAVPPLAQREEAAEGGRGGAIPGAVAHLADREGKAGLVGRKGGSVGGLGERLRGGRKVREVERSLL
jgi:hypothetical protein